MNREDIQKDLLDLLESECGLPADTSPDTPLFTSGLLDSVEIVRVLLLLEERFDLSIATLDVNLDNFDSMHQITEFVAARVDGRG